jgi:hypothetical protein
MRKAPSFRRPDEHFEEAYKHLSGLNNEDEHEDDRNVTLSYLVLVLVLGVRILGMVLVNQKVIRVFESKNNPMTG